MRGTRFSQEQIIAILKEEKAGTKLSELSSKHGVSEQTIYNWKAKYGDMTVSEEKRLKQMEEDNSKLKHIVDDQTMEIKELKYVVEKNF